MDETEREGAELEEAEVLAGRGREQYTGTPIPTAPLDADDHRGRLGIQHINVNLKLWKSFSITDAPAVRKIGVKG